MPQQAPIVFTVALPGQEPMTVALSRFAEQVSDFRPYWDDYFAPAWFRHVQAHYETQGRSTGDAWPPLSEAYAAWKEKHWPGLPIGVLSGALRESLTFPNDPNAVWEAGPRSLRVGTVVPWGMPQQTGWKSRRSSGPARPPLRVTEEFMVLLGKLLQEFGVKAAKEAGL